MRKPCTNHSIFTLSHLVYPILLAQEAGEITEAKAAELIGKDIVSLRELKAKAVKAIVKMVKSLPSPLISLLEGMKDWPKSSTAPKG
jgi:hypothetical protein